MTATPKRLTCKGCRFFQVSHDRWKPWKCTMFGFKSKELPARVVFSSTGMECAYFSQREQPIRAVKSRR